MAKPRNHPLTSSECQLSLSCQQFATVMCSSNPHMIVCYTFTINYYSHNLLCTLMQPSSSSALPSLPSHLTPNNHSTLCITTPHYVSTFHYVSTLFIMYHHFTLCINTLQYVSTLQIILKLCNTISYYISLPHMRYHQLTWCIIASHDISHHIMSHHLTLLSTPLILCIHWQTPGDRDVLMSVDGYGPHGERIMYYPQQGLQSYIYRERQPDLPFLKPGVMVQFTSLVSRHTVRVTCTAWGQLYDAENRIIDHTLLSTYFALYVNHE